jgi:DNA-binding transcriptional LysR family regulator
VLDPVTLDQLRMLVAVAEEGSFSAAARKVRRVQSAVSHAMAALESQLGVPLWDRTPRVPALTAEGRVLLAQARRVVAEADGLRRLSEGLVGGLEPSVALCVDAVFPVTALVDLCREFARAFPTVPLEVQTETLSAVAARVRDGACQLGVVGPAAQAEGLARRHLTTVRMVPVAAPAHPLAAHGGPLPAALLAEHVQVVLGERADAGSGPRGQTPDVAVLSPRTWRVVDLGTKHALLLGGLGWGNMPEHVVREDLARGRLVRLAPEAWGPDEHLLSLALVHRPDLAPGPATRWLEERLAQLCRRDVEVEAPPPAPARPAPARPAPGTRRPRSRRTR